MKFIRGLHNLTKSETGCVLTIGNFDGVHLGHQALIQRLLAEGKQRQLPVVVMLFEPQPLELFMGDRAPARLSHWSQKVQALAELGVDSVVCLKFDAQFSALSASNFVQLLVERLQVRLLAIGDDFRFGAGREGDFLLLQQMGKQYGFEVVATQTFIQQGQRVSSTAVRQALAANEFSLAEKLLGRPWSITGRVIYGDALGRTLGFPTANVLLKRKVMPVKGVFAVTVTGIARQPLPAVANIGTRPTIKGLRQQLEVHLLDRKLNLYGQRISVQLQHKIRDEQRFASLAELQTRIAKDVSIARDFFGLQLTK